jgi:hypothetical protein
MARIGATSSGFFVIHPQKLALLALYLPAPVVVITILTITCQTSVSGPSAFCNLITLLVTPHPHKCLRSECWVGRDTKKALVIKDQKRHSNENIHAKQDPNPCSILVHRRCHLLSVELDCCAYTCSCVQCQQVERSETVITIDDRPASRRWPRVTIRTPFKPRKSSIASIVHWTASVVPWCRIVSRIHSVCLSMSISIYKFCLTMSRG